MSSTPLCNGSPRPQEIMQKSVHQIYAGVWQKEKFVFPTFILMVQPSFVIGPGGGCVQA